MSETTKVAPAPPDTTDAEDGDDSARAVSVHIIDAGNCVSAAVSLNPEDPLSRVASAILAAARGAAHTHGPMLSALLTDMLTTQQAMANTQPGHPAALHPGIRVSDVDQVVAAHQGADHHPRLQIPGLSHPVDADVVRAILVAAGAF